MGNSLPVFDKALDTEPEPSTSSKEFPKNPTLQEVRSATDATLLLALEAAEMVAWDWDLRTDVVQWSGDARRFYGVGEDFPFHLAQHSLRLTHPEDATSTLDLLQAILEGAHEYRAEFRTIRPDNQKTMWAEVRAEVIRDETGTAIRAHGVTINITARKEAEAEAQRRDANHTAQLRALAQASLKITASATIEEALEVLAHEARAIIGAGCAVTRVNLHTDEGSRRLSTVDGASFCHELTTDEHREFVDELASRLGVMKRPLRTVDIQLPITPTWERVGVAPLHGFVTCPLVANNGTPMGFVLVANKQDADEDFDEDDEFILVQLAQLTSIAIEHTQAQETSQDRLIATQHARAQAEDANRAKDEFLAILSHELRAPLSSMLSWVHILKSRGFEDPTIVRAIDTLRRNISVQAQVINDLLDVSRIISGKLQLRRRPIDLSALVSSCVESIRPAAEGKKLSVVLDSEFGSSFVYGDGERLQQVMTNLLVNALKFTDTGGSINIRVRHTDGAAEIEVTDTGCGIDAELLPAIFDRFRQGDSSSTRRHGGLGLGLAIVKLIVELHKGSVSAYSEGSGKGAQFRVVLPVLEPALVAKLELVRQAEVVPPATLSTDLPLEVLLVEDDEDSREALSTLLRTRGVKVRTAGTVKEALSALEQQLPDIVISDIGMPDADGYMLIRHLRGNENEKARSLLAIAITGFASRQDQEAALRAGFDEHMGKPIDPDVLLERIRILVTARNSFSNS